jgi:hypothetical protein
VVYAFLTTDSLTGKRTVGLIAPDASWIAASVSPHNQLRPDRGSFSYVALPIEPGVAKSAALEISDHEMDGFHGGDPRTAASDSGERATIGHPMARVIIDVESDGVMATVEPLGANDGLDERFLPKGPSACTRLDGAEH